MNRMILYISIFICSLSNQSVAQNIIIKSVVHNSKIHLRYVCKSNNIWQEALKHGFYIEKAELGGSADTSIGEGIIYKPLFNQYKKPIEKGNKIWADSSSNSEYAFIYNMLYGITNNTMTKDSATANAMWGLLMKQADLSVNAAKALGLYVVDSIYNQNKFYLYRISIVDNNKKLLYQNKLLVSPSYVHQFNLITIDTYTVNANVVLMEFDAEKYLNQYAGFIIERKVESANQYASISKKPFIYIKSLNKSTNKNFIVTDTIPEYNKFYNYRIRGVSYFDMSCPNGPVIKVKAKEVINDYPIIDSIKLTHNDTKTTISYHVPQSIKYNLIKEVICTRSQIPGGASSIIYKSNQIENVKKIVDEQPLQTNYYQIKLVSNDLDTINSFEHFIMLPDRRPPEIPKNLKGKIDTLGKVLITWDANQEKDLLGYRIFRKNKVNEESVEITRRIQPINSYIDSISLNNLTKEIFYIVTAVDKSYNNSKYSIPLKLKKPDIVPPVAGIFKNIYHDDKGIHITWINSTSDDVLKIQLHKNNLTSNTSFLLREFNLKELGNSFFDTLLINSNAYSYRLKTIDESGNSTDITSPSIIYETGIRKEISDINFKIDLEERVIRLFWTYPLTDVFSYLIYRRENNGSSYLIKTLKGNLNDFTDKNVYPGNKYSYSIKAVLNSGAESKLSKEIKIIF